MKSFFERHFFLISVISIVTVSFFLFSPVYSNCYTSDNAIHVLMAANFEFSTDLYYWGQTRLGSFLPMTSAVLLKIFPISPIWMVSIVQYILLVLGFYFISAHIKNSLIKIPLCIFWFFPLNFFSAHVFIGQPYSAQFFFIGLAMFLVCKCIDIHKKATWKQNLQVFSIGFSFFISIWISDLSIFLIPGFICFVFVFFRTNNLHAPLISNFGYNHQPIRFKTYYLAFITGVLLAMIIFIYAKTANENLNGYAKFFSDVNQIGNGFSIVSNVLYKTFVFRIFDIPTSFISIFIFFILIVFFVAFLRNQKGLNSTNVISYFLLISSLIALVVTISSDWVERNGYNSRYFTISYIFLIVFIASHLMNLRFEKIKKITIILFWIASLFSLSNSLNYSLGKLTYESIPFKHAKMFTKELGPCGIIGDYWHSYVFSSTKPDEVVATPNDCCGPVRRPILVKEVMMREKIIIIRNGWLEKFPEYITQFGFGLVRKGRPLRFEDIDYCEYELQKK